MRTALECRLKADECVRIAAACEDRVNRKMMLVAVEHWLILAKTVALVERRDPAE